MTDQPDAPKSETTLPLIDREHLASMTGDDTELAAEVIEIFRHQAEIWSRMLDATSHPSQWADAAHALKGASLSLGALRLSQACADAETLGRSHSDDTPVSHARAAVALSEIKDHLGETLEAAAYLAHDLASGKGL